MNVIRAKMPNFYYGCSRVSNHFYVWFQGQNRVMAERERRKREDEELKEQQRKAEEERQRRMEAEWNENEANRQQTDPDEEARRHEQQWVSEIKFEKYAIF